ADRKANETRARIITRHKQQNEKHDQQFDADQKHADAHAGFERNFVNRKWFSFETRKRRARIRKRVDANPEPGNPITARDADEAEQENDWNCQRDWMIGHWF